MPPANALERLQPTCRHTLTHTPTLTLIPKLSATHAHTATLMQFTHTLWHTCAHTQSHAPMHTH